MAQHIQLRDGRQLAYAEYGDPAGRPVFFFQGTPSSRLMHPDEDITCAAGARLIVADRPGFGQSDFQAGRTLLDWPDDVTELARALGLDRFAVVGISGGGPYVSAVAYKIPQRLTTVAIVSGGGPSNAPHALGGLSRERQAAYQLFRRVPWLMRPLFWLSYNPRRDPEGFFKKYTANARGADRRIIQRPAMRTMLIASYAEAARQGVRGFVWELHLVTRPWGFSLRDITVPVLLWHGDQDASTPLAMAQYVAQTIPQCRASFLTGEGHFLLFEHWAEILQALLSSS
jgi:pimeloyl-ACP methyl ester carboxylesterase